MIVPVFVSAREAVWGKKKKSRCCSVKFWTWTTVSLGALYYSEDHKHLVIQTIVGQCLSALLAVLAEK